MLEFSGEAATSARATGEGAAIGEATLVAALGPERARVRLKELIAQAEAALSQWGTKADTLRAAAHYIAQRKA